MGRAPTSGNCHTCRKRRVKCDKSRPACERCTRGGFVCEGYESVLRMQNHAVVAGAAPGSVRLAKVQDVSSFPGAQNGQAGPGGGEDKVRSGTHRLSRPATSRSASPHTESRRGTSSPKKADTSRISGSRSPHEPFSHSSSSPSPVSTFSLDASSSPKCATSAVPGHAPGTSGNKASGVAAASSLLQVPEELSLVGFVDDISFSYFFQSYGWINMHSLLLQDDAMRSRLLVRNETGGNNNMTHDSLRALCYGLYGRDKSVPSLQDAGRRMYGKAIAQLRETIATTSKAELASLVKPISLMGSYSITIEKDLRFTHHAGLARILQMCGPEYFQSPSFLPIFESVRMTLVSDAMIRRKQTFLEKEEWRTVPWARCPEAKSTTSRLLDVVSALPGINEGVCGVMYDRIEWLAGGRHEVARIEHPDAVANLQARVEKFRQAAADWHRDWETEHPQLAPEVLAWAFSRVGDDTYRPGIAGVQGPDVFETSLAASLSSDWLNPDPFSSGAPESHSFMSDNAARPSYDPAVVATVMQDAALYTTVLVWIARFDKYLARAAQSPTCVDFFSVTTYNSCRCCDAMPSRRCETIPPPGTKPNVNEAMSWNVATCAMSVAPVRCVGSAPSDLEFPAPLASSSPLWSSPSSFSSALALPSLPRLDRNVLLPGDVRFVAQLRMLSWLSAQLPATRGPMLTTLAAIGFAYCAHDVRPAEGNAEIAAVAVARVFNSTGVDGATDVLLRSYR